MSEKKQSFWLTANQENVDQAELENMVFAEVVRRRLLPKGDDGYLKVKDGERIAQCAKKKLQDAVDRIKSGGSAFAGKSGAKPMLAPAAINELKKRPAASIGAVMGLEAQSQDAIVEAIDDQRRKDQKLNSSANLKPLDPRTLNKYIEQIAPEKCEKPAVRNARRIEAVNDPFNAINQCIANFQVFRPSLLGMGEDPSPANNHNLDEASFLLNGTAPMAVYGPAGSKLALKELRRGWARLNKGEKMQARSIKLLADTSESGEVAFALTGCGVWACAHTDACRKEFKAHVTKHLAYAAQT